jgi:hypothetical protein
MSISAAAVARAAAPAHPRRWPQLSRAAAFHLQASIILFFLAGSSAPTPLCGLYQVHGGVLATARSYGLAVIALAGAALLGTLLRRADGEKSL